jgi:hypothetical protein
VHDHSALGGGFTFAAAFIGYLPVRLCIALSQQARGVELWLVAVAFLHFLYRLS